MAQQKAAVQTEYNNWGVMMAGIVLSLLPIFTLFVVLQRQFVAGLTLGALKG